jgi:hypothetical protein
MQAASSTFFFEKLAAHLMQIDDSEQKNLRQAPEELFTRLALDRLNSNVRLCGHVRL